jgi:hypothetical protein
LSPAKLVGIWELPDGKEIQGQTILWLEQGDQRSGLIHIVHRHGAEFLQHNIQEEELVEFAKAVTSVGKKIGIQGSRDIYAVRTLVQTSYIVR